MGCCQSVAKDESSCVPSSISRPRSHTATPASASDVIYPDKVGHGGVKVFASSASASNGSASHAYTRLIVGSDWMFAALFEAHGCNSEGPADGDAAARFCAEQCYTEFLRAAGDAAVNSSSGADMRGSLMETLRVLDRRLLKSTELLPQDRMASGCAAVLLHMTLGPERVATVASLGPCAAVVGQRRGGLASATSAPLLLCGGQATSHHALREFTISLAAELGLLEHRTSSRGGAPGGSLKRLRMRISGAGAPEDAAHQRLQSWILATGAKMPQYTQNMAAPQALGFGCAKGMGWRASGGGAVGQGTRTKPRVGLEVQTARRVLVPGDECVVLLSGGAMATITPTDVALLMHRMGSLSIIPYESKPKPLALAPPRMSNGSGAAVQLDSLGAVGPRPMVPYTDGDALAPFNAARLLVQHAAAKVAVRKRELGPGPSPVCCVMALSLEWPQSSGGDTPLVAAACGAAVPAVCAAAAAAARDRRRAQYLWQLLRMYYKFPYKRKIATISRWHELFDRVIGEAMREARFKEVTAWKRLGAVLQVSTAGNVRSIPAQQSPSPRPQPNYFRSPRSQYQSPRSLSARQRSPRPLSVASGQSQQQSPVAASNSARYRSPRNGTTTSPRGPNGSPSIAPSTGARTSRSPLTGGGAPLASRLPTAPSHATGVVSPSPSMMGGAADPDSARVQASPATKTPRPPLGPGARSTTTTPRSITTPMGGAASHSQHQQQPSLTTPRSSLSTRTLTRDNTPYTSARQHTSRPGTDRSSGIPTPSAATAPSPKADTLAMTEPDANAEILGDGIVTVTSGHGENKTEGGSLGSAKAEGSSFGSAKTEGGGAALADLAAPSIQAAPAVAIPSSCPRISLISSNLAALDPTVPLFPPTAAVPNITIVVSEDLDSSHMPTVPAAGRTATAEPADTPEPSSGSTGSKAHTRPTLSAAWSCIPSLQLQFGTPGQAPAHPTPRLSAPGGPGHQPSPVATPQARSNNTWGGAPPASEQPIEAATAVLTGGAGAKTSGASRLPRPGAAISPATSPTLQTTPRARSVAGSRVQSSGNAAGSSHDSAPPSEVRPGAPSSAAVVAAAGTGVRPAPLKIDVEPLPPRGGRPAAVPFVGAVAAAGLPAAAGGHSSVGGGSDFDLLSPDADQLAVWAMEAVDAIISSPPQQQLQQQRIQQQLKPQASAPSSATGGTATRGAAAGGGGRATKSAGGIPSPLPGAPAATTLASGRGGSSGSVGGVSKPTVTSRIPLSPRCEGGVAKFTADSGAQRLGEAAGRA